MKYLLLLLLLINFKGFTQSKKIYYFDENGKPSTETIFKKTEVDGTKLIRYFDTDTSYIAKIYLFENYGKLDSKHFDGIKKHLKNLSGKILDGSKPIVISYISANDPSDIDPKYKLVNIYDTSKWKEAKKLRKRTDINLLWVQHTYNKPQIHRYNKKIDWLFDKDDYIAKTFLEYNCHIGSLIVIMPDGTYLAYYCVERAFDGVNDIIDKMKKTF